MLEWKKGSTRIAEIIERIRFEQKEWRKFIRERLRIERIVRKRN